VPARILFITGTDTGVGKTTVAAGLAAALTARGETVGVLKPAETGCEAAEGQLLASDARRLAFFSGCGAEAQTICPYRFREPLAPSVAAERAGQRIDLSVIRAACERLRAAHSVVLVEGAGGLLVPLVDRVTFADVCAELDAPLVIVVANKLGAVNHAALTMRCAERDGLRLAGYVINTITPQPDLAAETNVSVLTKLFGPPLGVIPWLGDVRETPADRARLARIFREHLALDRLQG